MRLINVGAILAMEAGNGNAVNNILKQWNDDELVKIRYGILSHCWGKHDEEVKFSEMERLPEMKKKSRDMVRKRPGYRKIVNTCEQACKDGLEWVWVDTCCIDKGSSAELSEAINSMYRWYANAGKCYAYLHDVKEKALPTATNKLKFRDTDGWPKWFSRGWTLQELIAPEEILFFNAEWEQLENGTKRSLARILFKITGIPTSILRYGLDSEQTCAAQIMSWAANRKTTRVEDRAYSLMGLFGIYMPMLYGEGQHAFRRLQLEILRTTNDHSIFGWQKPYITRSNVLAEDPKAFESCGDMVRMGPEEYRQYIPNENISQEQLLTCSITNAGIQIWLPVRPSNNSNSFEVALACKNAFGPIRIGLALFKSKCYRENLPNDAELWQFQQLYLAYNEKTRHEKAAIFKLNHSSLAHHGFVLAHVFPEHITSTETITVSEVFKAAVSYLNQKTNTRFAVAFGSLAGEPWACLTVPRSRSSFKNDARTASDDCDAIWSVFNHARLISGTGKTGAYCLVKRLHLSCSVSDIRLTLRRLPQPNTFSVALDIVQCAGCCMSNDRWQPYDIIHADEGERCMLRDIRAILTPNMSESLLVDTISNTFAQNLIDPGLQLGDFGHWNNKTFVREGNIFDHQTSVALDHIQHEIYHRGWLRNKGDCVMFGENPILCLRQPRCLSLPDDEHIRELLKALSAHLQGKCLVSTIVRCSEVHIKKRGAWNRWKHLPAMSWPDDDKPDAPDPQWEKVTVSVPLLIPTQPLIWYRERACKDTRAYFEQIRKHLNVLSKPLHNRLPNVDVAIDFLSKLFAGEGLKGYIGEIQFFGRIHAFWPNHTKGCSSVEADKEIQSGETPCTDTLGQVGMECLDLRIESLAQSLVQKLPTRGGGSIDGDLMLQCLTHLVPNVISNAVPKVIGPEILRHIDMAHQKPWRLQQKSDSDGNLNDEPDGDEGVNTLIRCDHEGCDSAEDDRAKAFEFLARSLVQQLPTRGGGSIDGDLMLQCLTHLPNVAPKAVPKAFGPEVLRLIAMAFQKPWRLQQKSDSDGNLNDESDGDEGVNTLIRCDHEGCDSTEDNRAKAFMDHDCIKALFGQVEELQTCFDAWGDDDEKRALEEDITGKILLACCRGVYHELAQVLPKVVDRLVHKDVERSTRDYRAMSLHHIGYLFNIMARGSKVDHSDHLWRITADAQAGISKHKLLLDARKHSAAMFAADKTFVAGQSCDSSREVKRKGPCDVEIDPSGHHAPKRRKLD